MPDDRMQVKHAEQDCCCNLRQNEAEHNACINPHLEFTLPSHYSLIIAEEKDSNPNVSPMIMDSAHRKKPPRSGVENICTGQGRGSSRMLHEKGNHVEENCTHQWHKQ